MDVTEIQELEELLLKTEVGDDSILLKISAKCLFKHKPNPDKSRQPHRQKISKCLTSTQSGTINKRAKDWPKITFGL